MVVEHEARHHTHTHTHQFVVSCKAGPTALNFSWTVFGQRSVGAIKTTSARGLRRRCTLLPVSCTPREANVRVPVQYSRHARHPVAPCPPPKVTCVPRISGITPIPVESLYTHS